MKTITRVLLVAALTAVSGPVLAQQEQTVVLPSPIMVVDFERVFGESLYGQRIAAELSAERERVQAENDAIAEELLAEESALTAARATMEPEAFREAADAFDERAQSVRASREAEQTRLVNIRDAERAQFIERIQPLIAQMMVERGAVVAMDRRSVIRAIGSANATEAAIELIDATLGDGKLDPSERPTLRPQEIPRAGDDDALIAPDLPQTDPDLSGPE